jgi:L-iditol 2-dehydrogenase
VRRTKAIFLGKDLNAMKNQVAYLIEPKKLEIHNSEISEPGKDDVLVEVKHVGVCGADVHNFLDPTNGGKRNVKFPVVLGHEAAGIVVKTGENVTNVSVGDRVALEPTIPCYKCQFCLEGRYNLCPNVDMIGIWPYNRGAFQKYLTHPANLCFKLPEGVSTLEGALIEPLSVGLHAVRRSGATLGATVLIIGVGCIGLMTLLACKAMGVTRIIVADLFENRLKTALKFGATATINTKGTDLVQELMNITANYGADVVFETAGNSVTAALTPYLVARGGKIVLVGNVRGSTSYDFNSIMMKEVDILTVFRYRNIYKIGLEFMAGGDMDVKSIVSVFAFRDIQKAFECAVEHKDTIVKAVVEI